VLSRYSHSALESFRSCPQKFKFSYLDKIELHSERTTADAYLGSAVHRGLTNLYQLAADGVLYPLEKLIEDYLAEWEKPKKLGIEVINENRTVEDYIALGRRMLTEYYETYKPFNQGRLLGAELNISFLLPQSPFQFKARIDRLWKREDGTIEICDYKTGSHFPLGPSDPSFRWQMGLYQLAVQSKYPDFTSIVLCQYFLKPNQVFCYQMRPDEIEEIAEQLRILVLDTVRAERLETFPTKEGFQCNYCDFKHLCPAKRHSSLLAAEAGNAETAEKTTAQAATELVDRYLDAHRTWKEAEAEKEALKVDLIRAAKDLSLDKLVGERGEVKVRISLDEKFVSISKDRDQFAELSQLVREFGFEDCFTLDEGLFYKTIYSKHRLSDPQMEQLKAYLLVQERSTVTKKEKEEE